MPHSLQEGVVGALKPHLADNLRHFILKFDGLALQDVVVSALFPLVLQVFFELRDLMLEGLAFFLPLAQDILDAMHLFLIGQRCLKGNLLNGRQRMAQGSFHVLHQ